MDNYRPVRIYFNNTFVGSLVLDDESMIKIKQGDTYVLVYDKPFAANVYRDVVRVIPLASIKEIVYGDG